MNGRRTGVWAVVVGGLIAFVVSEVRGHDFQVMALPGIHLAMAFRHDLAVSRLALVFVGNWVFYSLVLALIFWVARKVQARRHE